MSVEGIKNFIISSIVIVGLYIFIQEKNNLNEPVVPSLNEMVQAINKNSENNENNENLIDDIEREMIPHQNSRYGNQNGRNFNKRKEVMYNTHADSDRFFSESMGEISKGSIGQLMGFNESSDSFAPIDNSFQNPTYSSNLVGRTDIANNFNEQTNTMYTRNPQMNLDQMKTGAGFNIDNTMYYQ